jgi:hypothetical protein
MSKVICALSILFANVVMANSAPTPAELIAFDQTISAQAARGTLDEQVLRAAVMPDQTALNKREWLLRAAQTPAPALAFLSHDTLRLDYLGSDGVGERCESALTISDQTDVRTELAAAGAAKSVLWLRIHPQKDHHLALSSLGSGIDTVLSVYQNCGQDFVAKSDDYTGLQALAALPKGDTDLFIKAENLGPAGALRLRTILTATVSGSVVRRDNGAAIANLRVTFFVTPQNSAGDTLTNSSGEYVYSYFGDGTATLFARSSSSYTAQQIGYVDRAYLDILCDDTSSDLSACSPAGLSPIIVNPDNNTGNVGFRLDDAARLTARVTRESTGSTVQYVDVRLFDATGRQLRLLTTDAAGRAVFTGLIPGKEYRLAARITDFLSQVFENVLCRDLTCLLTRGTPIILAPGQRRDVGFVLPDATNTAPTSGVRIGFDGPTIGSFFREAQLYYPNRLLATSRQVSDSLVSLNSVPAGNYYLVGKSNYSRSVVYPNVVCANDCLAELDQGQLISLPLSTGTELTITLPLFPKISGQIRSANNSSLDGVRISLVDANGTFTAALFPYAADISQYTSPPLPPGNYFLRVASDAHADQAYPGVRCESFVPVGSCPGVLPINLQTSITGVNFLLEESASISGRIGGVNASGSGYGVFSFNGNDFSPSQLGRVRFLDAGNYQVDDLPSGNYKFGADISGTFPQIFPNINCRVNLSSGRPFDLCPANVGTTVSLATNQLLGGVDFQLKQRGVSGRVVSSETSQPLVGVALDLWRRDIFSLNYAATTSSGVDGRFVFQGNIWPYGQNFVSTDNAQGFVDEIYNDVRCPLGSAYAGLCDATSGQSLNLAPWFDDPATPPLLIALDPVIPIGTLFRSGFE